jgi:hypothetical protein
MICRGNCIAKPQAASCIPSYCRSPVVIYKDLNLDTCYRTGYRTEAPKFSRLKIINSYGRNEIHKANYITFQLLPLNKIPFSQLFGFVLSFLDN